MPSSLKLIFVCLRRMFTGLRFFAGWRSMVSQLAHNQQNADSNPAPATTIPTQHDMGGASDRRMLGRAAERREIPSSSRLGLLQDRLWCFWFSTMEAAASAARRR